ncbi:MAG: peptidylprolyl isomerase, partial [Treponemataceae bacterium]
HVETPWLDGKHTVFGKVAEGQDVVNKIAQDDEIKSLTIVRSGKDAENFTATQAKFDELSANLVLEAKKKSEKAQSESLKLVEEKYGNYTKLDNGLRYNIITAGSGDKIGAEKSVDVHYTGKLMNDSVFDSSIERGEPLNFTTASGQLIPGFDLMVQDMQKGEKRTIVIPPDLGYGAAGAGGVIAPNSFIMFELEVVDVK